MGCGAPTRAYAPTSACRVSRTPGSRTSCGERQPA
jgi:hypothetical protein